MFRLDSGTRIIHTGDLDVETTVRILRNRFGGPGGSTKVSVDVSGNFRPEVSDCHVTYFEPAQVREYSLMVRPGKIIVWGHEANGDGVVTPTHDELDWFFRDLLDAEQMQLEVA